VKPRRRRAADIGRVASVVQRLAVLLAAGVAPVSAWGYLNGRDARSGGARGKVGGDVELAERVAQTAVAGIPIPEAILAAAAGQPAAEGTAWRGLAAAWSVATRAGAPLAPTLRSFAASLRELAQAQREIRVALAAPKATARLVIALPPIGMLCGLLLGFDTFGVLFTRPVGWVCLAVGTVLLGGATAWNRRLVRSAQPRNITPGIALDLLAIAVAGGGSLERARSSVAAAMADCGIESGDSSEAIADILELSRRAGVPAADLLRSEADEARRSARADVQARAQTLSIRLMIPLGVCVLPAFMVLSVVPLLVAVVTSTSIG
jgi:tight adherence protein B